MKKISILLILSFIIFEINAQSLDQNTINQLRMSFQQTPANSAMINAISNNKYKDLTVNRAIAGKDDDYFKYEVKGGHITNQNQSGRCWMYTSLNILRPIVMKHFNISDFEFSETYLYFWDMLEKSNTYLERIEETANLDVYSREVSQLFDSPVDDGGAWNSFVNLVEKYGVVPSNVMPETEHSKNTAELTGLLKVLLRQYGLEIRDMVTAKKTKADIDKRKVEMLQDVYRILVYSLGEPPQNFQWRCKNKSGKLADYQTYTPQTFWKQAIGVDINNYVMLMDDPTRPYYKLYSKQWDRNTYEGIDWTFVNVPVNEIKKYALLSLKDTTMMYFSCDVGKQLSGNDGTLDLKNFDYGDLFGVNLNMTRSRQMMTHQSGSTHGMALCGVDVDSNDNPTKWKLENSWGATYGNNGYLTMTDEWFNQFFYRIVIEKKYLPAKILDVLKQKPEQVPYYFPAFSSDN